MSASINKVILVGNLGRDPEVRITQETHKVVTLSIATSEQWKDRTTEERKERVEWHRVVVFNARLCDFAERFIKKGQRIYIEGQLQSRKWTDQQNQEHRVQEIVIRYKGDIVILDSRQEGNTMRDNGPSMDLSAISASDIDDEIPF